MTSGNGNAHLYTTVEYLVLGKRCRKPKFVMFSEHFQGYTRAVVKWHMAYVKHTSSRLDISGFLGSKRYVCDRSHAECCAYLVATISCALENDDYVWQEEYC